MNIWNLFAKSPKNLPEGHEIFSGVYHGGDAKYVFIPSEDGNIFDGEFSFYLKVARGEYRKADGFFVMNKKEGDWTFDVKTNASQMKLNTHFSNGYIDGHLEYSFEELTMNGVALTCFSTTIVDGMVKGEIVGAFDGGKFRGFCDEDGYPEGEWTHESKEYVKKEKWDHGTLLESYEINLEFKRKSPYKTRFRERINYILDADCQRLTTIVGRGTENKLIHIPHK